ncbi:hypothetical protein [Burkholderia cepacia]|uniref:hypothetical protein n=1 Tax=Burkholderia cepacia TaxID=292 RepID=UPI000A76FDDF|nr:hypothetical protein [Burkholderia cepacia]
MTANVFWIVANVFIVLLWFVLGFWWMPKVVKRAMYERESKKKKMGAILTLIVTGVFFNFYVFSLPTYIWQKFFVRKPSARMLSVATLIAQENGQKLTLEQINVSKSCQRFLLENGSTYVEEPGHFWSRKKETSGEQKNGK